MGGTFTAEALEKIQTSSNVTSSLISVDFSTMRASEIPPTDFVCENPNCISNPANGQREVKPFFIGNICQYCEWEVKKKSFILRTEDEEEEEEDEEHEDGE